ncbi:MAG: potassium transporter Kup [Ancalomicrobiaceae bacterium]|nr:potassium transporter Kup [Ancalomicrobiaceae bacterium]
MTESVVETTDTASSPHHGPNGSSNGDSHNSSHSHPDNLWALALGSVGVVYGDIGTSPLYALRESVAHTARAGVLDRDNVIGVVSLLLWALIITVTLKYVLVLMRADNKGEGGTLSLLALIEGKLGTRTAFVFTLGAAGAALFYGDSIITPAISVLSAVEGLKLLSDVEGIKEWIPNLDPYVLPITVVILTGLFAVQSRGTAAVAKWFGPIMAIWFAILIVGGLIHIVDDPGIFLAFDPLRGVEFLTQHGFLGFVVLGSVFLAVTGGEALYADMGHFGRRPIQIAWLGLVFPALAINYLGQGALVLHHPETLKQPFYLMFPAWSLIPMILMATVATIIASQAVITGAYSMTQQAVQLGLLPRFETRHTSETLAGQIYMPRVNWLLLIGVLFLVLLFKSSDNLGAAYGIAVTGTMLVTSLLAFVVFHRVWNWPVWLSALIIAPFICVDAVFMVSNLLKLFEGGYVPVMLASSMIVAMWTWVRGTNIVFMKSRRESVPLDSLVRMLARSKPFRPPGMAVFLTSDPETAPAALMHNLKHNNVLHTKNVILTVRTAPTPNVPEETRVVIEPISDDFTRIVVTFGYMESPNVPKALAACRKMGLKFDIMTTTFFVGKRTFKASPTSGMPLWQDKLFIAMAKDAANATDFYHIPSGRVVELGQQITV